MSLGLPHHGVNHASEIVGGTPEDTLTEGTREDGRRREEAMSAVLVQLEV